MGETLQAGQTVSVIGSPVNAQGGASQSVLSAQAYSSSDPTVFTVAPDPSTPGGVIITAVAPGTATLTETATATEVSGATGSIMGVATIVVTPAPVAPAESIVFTFGTPETPAVASLVKG
jgi:hypothetical protein